MGYSIADQLKDGFSWFGHVAKDVFVPVGEGILSTITTGNPVPAIMGGVKGMSSFVSDVSDTASGDYQNKGFDQALMDAKAKAAGGGAGAGGGGQPRPPTREEIQAAYRQRVAASGVSTEAVQAQMAVANAIQAGRTYQSVMNMVNAKRALGASQAKAQYAALQKYSDARVDAAGLSGPADFLPTAAQYSAVKQQRINAMAAAIRANTSFEDEVNARAGSMDADGLTRRAQPGESLMPGGQPLGRQITEGDMNPSQRYGISAGAKSYEARMQSGSIQANGGIMSSVYNG